MSGVQYSVHDFGREIGQFIMVNLKKEPDWITITANQERNGANLSKIIVMEVVKSDKL